MSDGMARWFDLGFVILMLGLPGPYVFWYRKNQLREIASETAARIREETRSLFVGFMIAWLVTFTGMLVWTAGAVAGIHPLGGVVHLFWPVFCGFHLLWWPLAVPLMNRTQQLLEQEGAVAPSRPEGTFRAASLRARRVGDYLPSFSFPLAVVVAVLGPMCVGGWLWLHPEMEQRLLIGAVSFGITGLLAMVVWMFCMKLVLVEQLPGAGGVLNEETEALRRFRMQGFYWFMLLMAVLMFGAAFLFVKIGRGAIMEETVGLVGGVVGTVVGVGGGVFGTLASWRAHSLGMKVAERK